ncbi:MAG: multicopper oxidase family protein [Armatimonadetes bacterium]|nr:multicopper oxidase family protein [Armatimonadota bacterium]
MDRREFLRRASIGAAGVMAGGLGGILPAKGGQRTRGPLLGIAIDNERDYWPILPGQETFVQRMVVRHLEGDPNKIQPIPGSFLAPTLRLTKGDTLRCLMTNNLYDPSIIHWHGVNTSEHNDGLPNHDVDQGGVYNYNFPIGNRAGTYWYHPHPNNFTGFQVYFGMAGSLIVSDSEEQSLPLPRGEFDFPLIIQDKRFDDNNQFLYGVNPFIGTIGDRVLVNGKPDFELSAATRVYRLRLINGSNARLYKLVWSNGLPLHVIGTDGGLLDKPYQKPYVMLGPGQRVELWADFRNLPVGTTLTLKSLEFPGTAVGFGGGQGPHNGSAIDVMKVRIDRNEIESLTLPRTLASFERHDYSQCINADRPRKFAFSFDGGWFVNGHSYQEGQVARNEIVENRTLECWEFVNETGSLAVTHPMHIHGPQFQIYRRSCLPEFRSAWKGVREGYVDEGWRDTVVLMPGERVQLLIKFGPHAGLSLYHCHNLDHEDMGMMRHYKIV